jgi:O-antigen/teichoic acid export membrane protein
VSLSDPLDDFDSAFVGAAATVPSAAALPEAQETLRAERGRRLKLSLLSSLVVRPLSLITPLVIVPLFLRYLGSERYGLYEGIGAFVAWLQLSNIGLGLGLVNGLTDCHVANDRLLARRYVTAMVAALIAITAIGLVLVTLLVPVVNWHWLFPTSDPTGWRETPWAVWVAAALTLSGLAASLPPSVYAAYQELHRNNLWDAASKLATLLACVALVYTPLGLVGAIIAAAGVPIVVRLLNIADLFLREKPWLRPKLSLFDWQLLKGLMGQGIFLFILQMSVVAIYQTDKLIIGNVLGAGEVPEYAILGRLFLMVYGVFMLLLMPLWPAYGEALRRGDWVWVRRGVRWSLWLGCGLMLCCGAGMLLCGNQVLRLWTWGQDLHVSHSLIVAMTLMFALRAWVDSRSIVLNSANVLLPQIYVFGAHAVANTALAIILAHRMGVEGVAWATVITSLLTSFWGYPWMLRRLFKQKIPGQTPAQK